MVTTDLKEVFKMLFTAPAEASIEAEHNYRKIWMQWLQDLEHMISARKLKGEPLKHALLNQIKLAPVMKFDGIVECGVTMRIASVVEKGKSLSSGLQLGVIGSTGSFGFMHRQSNESILQAKTQYTITNREVSLTDYLGNFGIELATAKDITEAIKFLETEPLKPAPVTTGKDTT